MYEKSKADKLDISLFENPTSEYRAAPFWAWNCDLDEDELLWQIERLKEMGMGGFHMHCRDGMSTRYLSPKFMSLVKSCVDKAEREEMLAYLYDEDKFPSGFAGGYLTKNKKFRQRGVIFTTKKIEDTVPFKQAVNEGKTAFIAAYDVKLNEKGEIVEYRRIGEDELSDGIKRYLYMFTSEPSDWFNLQTYSDTLNKEAIDKFIDITYETYKRAVGDSFGGSVLSMFTDEPRFMFKVPLPTPFSTDDAQLPWTPEFPKLFKKARGYDIVEKMPELFWDLPNGEPSKARYDYHDYICQLFTDSFAANCGNWCKENGIHLTGHMMEEDTLIRQTCAIGETMRAYEHFGIPGIDMLCNEKCFNSVKQAQSAVHQYGKPGLMSELYGVTNWDFDFRGHKFQGDWQAALGVTLRVPHLSWVSMKGSAKRDYPASINYQAPWYKEYRYVEDHFARLNTVLTRGKPVVKVAVLHPIESVWLHFGPNQTTARTRDQLDANFENLTEWLLGNHIDFDFICESTLPKQVADITQKLTVGAMQYDVVILPGVETIRGTTLAVLRQFVANGGRVIIAGSAPVFVDAARSDEGRRLAESCVCVSFEKSAILNALEEHRLVSVRRTDGRPSEDMIYALREDGEDTWLFIARKEQTFKGYSSDAAIWNDVTVTVKGEYTPVLYNTVTGRTEGLYFDYVNGNTVIPRRVFASDSLLIRLSAKTNPNPGNDIHRRIAKSHRFFGPVEYSMEEGNVLLLDIAEYRLDDDPYNPQEEIIRISNTLKEKLGYPGMSCQPWVMKAGKAEHTVTVKYTVDCARGFSGIRLATEDLSCATILLNGKKFLNGWTVT